MRSVIYQLILFLYTNSQDDVYALAARNILKNIDKVKDCSITDLADLCYVSPATISRLCRKLSFDSFFEFKNAIENNSAQFSNIYFPKYSSLKDEHISEQELLEKHFKSIQSTLEETYKCIDVNTIKSICEAIHNGKNIIFIGFHTAQFASIQFQEKLTSLRKDTYGSLNINEQLNLTKKATSDDVLILASLTGGFVRSNPNLIRYFKHSQATKIVFSNSDELNSLSDYHINTLGNSDSLISKFNLTYVYELLEMFYTDMYK